MSAQWSANDSGHPGIGGHARTTQMRRDWYVVTVTGWYGARP